MKKTMIKFLTDFIFLLLGCILLAVSINVFLLPNKISAGGISTIGTVLFYLFGIKMSLTNLFFNVILFIFGYKYLGKYAVVQTAAEVDKMMELCDPESVYLLFDSGHLAYCGEDYMAVLKKYAKRIKHVHLKDIRPEIVKKVKEEHLSFLQGVRLGAFTVPGDGAIDFAPIFDELDKAGYEGWMLVEAEQDPAVANPFKYAKMARKYIAEKAGI